MILVCDFGVLLKHFGRFCMQLDEPVVAYLAETNIDAHMVKQFLVTNEVPAAVVEDLSAVVLSVVGPTTLHRPRVWVSQCDKERSDALVAEYQANRLKRSTVVVPVDAEPTLTVPIKVECEDCGEITAFAADLKGSIQDCPECGEFLDVGESDWGDDFDYGAAHPEPDPNSE